MWVSVGLAAWISTTDKETTILPKTIREVVAAFDDAAALDSAVFDLETHGFDRAAFSVLTTEATVARELGHRYRQVQDVEDNPRVPRETFFSRMSRLEAEFLPAPGLASLGWLTLAGVGGGLPAVIAAGVGGLIGAVLGGLIQQHYAARIQEQLAMGGIVLWVNVRNSAEEEQALLTLRGHGAHDVHAHELAV
jgi:hypothetical protein